MGLLEKLKSLLFGNDSIETKDENKSNHSDVSAETPASVVELKTKAEHESLQAAGVDNNDEIQKVEQKQIINKPKEEKPVADKITVGNVRISNVICDCNGGWRLIAGNIAIKKGDRFIFNYYGSLIPQALHSFFHVESIEPGSSLSIYIRCNGNSYLGNIKRETHDIENNYPIIWIFFDKKLAVEEFLNKEFPSLSLIFTQTSELNVFNLQIQDIPDTLSAEDILKRVNSSLEFKELNQKPIDVEHSGSENRGVLSKKDDEMFKSQTIVHPETPSCIDDANAGFTDSRFDEEIETDMQKTIELISAADDDKDVTEVKQGLLNTSLYDKQETPRTNGSDSLMYSEIPNKCFVNDSIYQAGRRKPVMLDMDKVLKAEEGMQKTAELLYVANDEDEPKDDPSQNESLRDKLDAQRMNASTPLTSSESPHKYIKLLNSLSPLHIQFLTVLLHTPENTDELARIAREAGCLPEMCFDEINEMAYDIIGDNIIEDSQISECYLSLLCEAETQIHTENRIHHDNFSLSPKPSDVLGMSAVDSHGKHEDTYFENGSKLETEDEKTSVRTSIVQKHIVMEKKDSISKHIESIHNEVQSVHPHTAESNDPESSNKIYEYDTWRLIPHKFAIKEIDDSFFGCCGCIIPSALYSFFQVEEMELGSCIDIILNYNGKSYLGNILREDNYRRDSSIIGIFFDEDLMASIICSKQVSLIFIVTSERNVYNLQIQEIPKKISITDLQNLLNCGENFTFKVNKQQFNKEETIQEKNNEFQITETGVQSSSQKNEISSNVSKLTENVLSNSSFMSEWELIPNTLAILCLGHHAIDFKTLTIPANIASYFYPQGLKLQSYAKSLIMMNDGNKYRCTLFRKSNNHTIIFSSSLLKYLTAKVLECVAEKTHLFIFFELTEVLQLRIQMGISVRTLKDCKSFLEDCKYEVQENSTQPSELGRSQKDLVFSLMQILDGAFIHVVDKDKQVLDTTSETSIVSSSTTSNSTNIDSKDINQNFESDKLHINSTDFTQNQSSSSSSKHQFEVHQNICQDAFNEKREIAELEESFIFKGIDNTKGVDIPKKCALNDSLSLAGRRKSVVLDMDKVLKAEEGMQKTAKLLHVENDEDEPEDDSSQNESLRDKLDAQRMNASTPLVSSESIDYYIKLLDSLSPLHIQFLTVMLSNSQNSEELVKIARDAGCLPGMCMDEINEIAYDLIGDNIIEDSQISECYLSSLQLALKLKRKNNS